MDAELSLVVGHGQSGLHLVVARSTARLRARWVSALAWALTLPFALALVQSGLVQARLLPAASLRWLDGEGWLRLLTLGPPLAVLLLVAARVRLHGSRGEGGWRAAVVARLSVLDAVAGALAAVVAVIFFGHLAADAWACANGVTRAC